MEENKELARAVGAFSRLLYPPGRSPSRSSGETQSDVRSCSPPVAATSVDSVWMLLASAGSGRRHKTRREGFYLLPIIADLAHPVSGILCRSPVTPDTRYQQLTPQTAAVLAGITEEIRKHLYFQSHTFGRCLHKASAQFSAREMWR